MLLTGTRVSEACGLKWDAVELERNLVRIVRRVSWDKINKNPSLDNVTKTANSARLLILPKRLQALVMEMKKEAQSDLVFTDRKGELLRYNAIQSAFNSGFVALGLPWRSIHICRRTFATLALMETKSLSAVQASLGHASKKQLNCMPRLWRFWVQRQKRKPLLLFSKTVVYKLVYFQRSGSVKKIPVKIPYRFSKIKLSNFKKLEDYWCPRREQKKGP